MFKFEAPHEEQIIKLQDDYRWLSIMKYRFTSNDHHEFNSSVFFDDLIASPVYQNNYLTPWREGSQNARGPFAIGNLHSSQYVQLSKTEFMREFFSVLQDPYYSEPTKEILDQIDQIYLINSEHMSYFKFERQHRPTQFHNDEYEFDFEWSSILWEFVEFEAVDLEKELLYLLVFGFE